jgi:8-oxo-dGTP pyrophosphatase MutT (NUDIX family)
VHSVVMSAGLRIPQDSGLAGMSLTRVAQPSRLVRLSRLRKLCECEQVAAVCYRVRGGGIEFLLVRTRGGGRWTFPKGSAERGLTHAQAAALEAFEEAGVHGRIEEASFARYVRRARGRARKSSARSGEREVAVSAHLCEVSRLSPPQESKRNRTWFSVEDAKRRLQEGREKDDGAEFLRVVDRAVARIQQEGVGIDILDSYRQSRRPGKNDALRKVQFEALVEAQDRREEASFVPFIRGQLAAMERAAVPAGDVLPCEVLQFETVREKKAKALGTGTNLRG